MHPSVLRTGNAERAGGPWWRTRFTVERFSDHNGIYPENVAVAVERVGVVTIRTRPQATVPYFPRWIVPPYASIRIWARPSLRPRLLAKALFGAVLVGSLITAPNRKWPRFLDAVSNARTIRIWISNGVLRAGL